MKNNKLSESVKKEIKDYIEILKKEIPLRKVILYGSYAKGKAHEDSDIDLAIISDPFAKDPHDEMVNLMMLSQRISDRISPIPFRPVEMNMKYHSLIAEIKKHGQVVFEE